MPGYISNFGQMDNNQKEALFQSVLKGYLLVNNFLVAIPEPDIGDDIWVARLEKDNYKIYPAQIKSAFVWHPLRGGNVKRYTINIKYHKLELTLTRNFIYFFGLYDPAYEPSKFHIGCIPSSFFLNHWEFLKEKKVTITKSGGKRINLGVDYYVGENEYYIFVKPLVKIISFFQNYDAIP